MVIRHATLSPNPSPNPSPKREESQAAALFASSLPF